MGIKQTINQEVAINSLYFRGATSFKSFPKEITYDNQQITFMETGFRYILQKGKTLFQLFDMSDGKKVYRLQYDAGQMTWTLLKITTLPPSTNF